jgi:TPR repeat protein
MAARVRNEDSAMEQGRKYFYGIRTKKNYWRAFPLFLDAAQHGYVHAQFMVGFAFRDGLRTQEKITQSRKWWASAAKRDHPGALFNLALDYDYGRGVRPNPRKAFGLYKRGAELGDREAQCNLAVAYLDGRGIKRDLQGNDWMKRAALQADPKAQYNLGLAHLEGEGRKQNRKIAKFWLSKAAGQGHVRARKSLRTVKVRDPQ